MTSTTKSSSQKSHQHQTDHEMDLPERLVQRASESGVSMHPLEVVNFYVAFKSKSLILLFHPSHSENLLLALDRAISQALLPHFAGKTRAYKGLRQRLSAELGDQFPRTLAYLNEQLAYYNGSRGQFIDGPRDLVCGMQVDSQRAAAKSEYQGRLYYFCSNGCKKALDKDPQKYIKPDLER